MHAWINNKTYRSLIVGPLTLAVFFSCTLYGWIGTPTVLAATSVLEFTPKLTVPKNQDLSFQIKVQEAVDSVYLYFRRLASVDPFVEEPLKKVTQTAFEVTLALTEWDFEWDKIEYYFVAYRGSKPLETSETFIVSFIEKPSMSDLTTVPSQLLNKNQFDELRRIPIWKKWWFWVPVTVAVGGLAYYLSDDDEKDTANFALSNFRCELDSSIARCKASSANCTDIEIVFFENCGQCKVRFAMDVSSGTKPFRGTWTIERWVYGGYRTPLKETITEDFTTSDNVIYSQWYDNCLFYYPKQNVIPLAVTLSAQDKNNKAFPYEATYQFWGWSGN